MEPKDAPALVAAIVAAAGLVIRVVIMLNAKIRAHTVATQSLTLANLLGEQIQEEQIGRSRSTAMNLRRELLIRGHFATEEYLLRTAPKPVNVVELMLNVIIVVLLTLAVWSMRDVPPEWETTRNVMGWALPLLGLTFIAVQMGSTNKRIQIRDAVTARGDKWSKE